MSVEKKVKYLDIKNGIHVWREISQSVSDLRNDPTKKKIYSRFSPIL